MHTLVYVGLSAPKTAATNGMEARSGIGRLLIAFAVILSFATVMEVVALSRRGADDGKRLAQADLQQGERP